MNTTIYYFTGTGNSLKVAKDLAIQLKDTELIQISKNNLEAKTKADKIGIVFPVYFSGLPLMVKDFLEKLKIDKKTYVFAIPTCGRSPGRAIKQIQDILKLKEIELSSAFTVIMPGNYQIMYSPASLEKQKQIFTEEQTNIVAIAESINKGKIVKLNAKGILDAVIYSFFKPYKQDKNFRVDTKCNGCSTCSKVCPADNIKIVDKKPVWQNKCEQCMACMQWCPQQSIQYKKNTINRGRYQNPDIKLPEIFRKA